MTDQPTNDIAAAFENNAVAVGVLDDAYSPRLIELYGELGLDFVWLDLEHGGPSPWDGDRLTTLLRAAERTDTEPLIRVPTPDPTVVRKVLDLGVRNVFLPRVTGPDEVRAAVRAGRFEYDDGPGDRGLAAPRASRYGLVDAYPETEDREVLVGVTIETVAAVEAIDEILAVPELGFVFLGPYDLSVAMGHPGAVDHPDVQAAIDQVRSAAQDAAVPIGGLSFGPDDRARKVEAGYRLLNVGSTTGALQAAATDWLDHS